MIFGMVRLRKGNTTKKLGLFAYRIETKIFECGWVLERGRMGVGRPGTCWWMRGKQMLRGVAKHGLGHGAVSGRDAACSPERTQWEYLVSSHETVRTQSPLSRRRGVW